MHARLQRARHLVRFINDVSGVGDQRCAAPAPGRAQGIGKTVITQLQRRAPGATANSGPSRQRRRLGDVMTGITYVFLFEVRST